MESASTLVTTNAGYVDSPSFQDATTHTENAKEELSHVARTPQEPQPDHEFWLDDGNLALIAGDVEFRVYKGPLIATSPVFNTMLLLPQADGTAPSQCTCNHKPAVEATRAEDDEGPPESQADAPGKTPRLVSLDDTADDHLLIECVVVLRLTNPHSMPCQPVSAWEISMTWSQSYN